MRKLFYNCVNQECESHQEVLRTFKTSTGTISRVSKDNSFQYNKEDGDDTPEYCPYCEQALKNIGEHNPVFLGTSLMSLGQKQQMLLSRSRAHERTGERRG